MENSLKIFNQNQSWVEKRKVSIQLNASLQFSAKKDGRFKGAITAATLRDKSNGPPSGKGRRSAGLWVKRGGSTRERANAVTILKLKCISGARLKIHQTTGIICTTCL